MQREIKRLFKPTSDIPLLGHHGMGSQSMAKLVIHAAADVMHSQSIKLYNAAISTVERSVS